MIGPDPPVHPGEILGEEFLTPLGLTPYGVARACRVPRTRIERLTREETPLTADTALRLGRCFGTGPEFWMTLQTLHDLSVAALTAPDRHHLFKQPHARGVAQRQRFGQRHADRQHRRQRSRAGGRDFLMEEPHHARPDAIDRILRRDVHE